MVKSYPYRTGWSLRHSLSSSTCLLKENTTTFPKYNPRGFLWERMNSDMAVSVQASVLRDRKMHTFCLRFQLGFLLKHTSDPHSPRSSTTPSVRSTPTPCDASPSPGVSSTLISIFIRTA